MKNTIQFTNCYKHWELSRPSVMNGCILSYLYINKNFEGKILN